MYGNYNILLQNLWDPTPKPFGSNSKTFKIFYHPPQLSFWVLKIVITKEAGGFWWTPVK